MVQKYGRAPLEWVVTGVWIGLPPRTSGVENFT